MGRDVGVGTLFTIFAVAACQPSVALEDAGTAEDAPSSLDATVDTLDASTAVDAIDEAADVQGTSCDADVPDGGLGCGGSGLIGSTLVTSTCGVADADAGFLDAGIGPGGGRNIVAVRYADCCGYSPKVFRGQLLVSTVSSKPFSIEYELYLEEIGSGHGSVDRTFWVPKTAPFPASGGGCGGPATVWLEQGRLTTQITYGNRQLVITWGRQTQ